MPLGNDPAASTSPDCALVMAIRAEAKVVLSLSSMTVSPSAMPIGSSPGKKVVEYPLKAPPALLSPSRSILGKPSAGIANSTWSNGARAETPSCASAVRRPEPETVSATASPLVQPGRLTIS